MARTKQPKPPARSTPASTSKPLSPAGKADVVPQPPAEPRGSKVKGPLPPVVEDARAEQRRDPGRCKNCGRTGTLNTRVSCTDCGFTTPAP